MVFKKVFAVSCLITGLSLAGFYIQYELEQSYRLKRDEKINKILDEEDQRNNVLNYNELLKK